ncbi:MAG: hypothetical protein BZY75_05900 [SAR202 cluster bacterium Io17-Chloro-G7]|nr:MAG: hypothetical protein BZY75_05900 [SAR202 cluster bacterium Io17-Chloro-G7]
MKFGVFYQLPCGEGQTVSARYDDTIAQARLADELGFDNVWLAELHFNGRFSVMPAPLMIGAAIAATTKKIKIGTAVNLVPLHHPIRLAEETATLDILSHGRAVFGIGRGSNPRHFDGFGVDMEGGRNSFREAVDLILQAWTNDEVNFKGEHFNVEGVRVEPKPQQKPHPPVYVATNSPDTFGMVGEMGHSVLLAPMISTIEGAQAGLKEFRRNLIDGAPGGKVNVNVPTFVAETRKKALAGFEGSIDNYLGTLRATSHGRGMERANMLNYGLVDADFAAIGDPEGCADRLRQIQQMYDADEFMCWFNTGGMVSQEEVSKSMRLFAEKVIPQFS